VYRILLGVAGTAFVLGVALVLLPDNDAAWFTYNTTESDDGGSMGITFTGATLITDRDMYGYLLIAVSALIAAGLFGYRLGSRRVD
jgi:hypothetical protein